MVAEEGRAMCQVLLRDGRRGGAADMRWRLDWTKAAQELDGPTFNVFVTNPVQYICAAVDHCGVRWLDHS